MSRALSKAQAVIQKAAGDQAKWAATLDQLQRRRAAIESTLGDTVLDDPGSADKLTAELNEIATRTTVAASTLAVAGRRLREARRAVLLVEAIDEDDAAKALERESQRITDQVDAARATLERLDGTSWVRFERRQGVEYSPEPLVGTPRAEAPESQARVHRLRAAVARHVHERGAVPAFVHELGDLAVRALWSTQITREHMTDGVRTYLDLPEQSLAFE